MEEKNETMDQKGRKKKDIIKGKREGKVKRRKRRMEEEGRKERKRVKCIRKI